MRAPFDVGVIGAGPAGATAALMLARRGASVVLIDRCDTRAVLGESLPPAATPVLQQLGLSDRFLIDGHQPAHGNRSVWGGSNVDHYDFIRSPYGSAWHIDRSRFDRMLKDAFVEAGGIEYGHTRLLACNQGSRGMWELGLGPSSPSLPLPEAIVARPSVADPCSRVWRRLSQEGERELGRDCSHIHARFLVDATGRARRIARSHGVGTRSYDHLIGIIGVARPLMAASTLSLENVSSGSSCVDANDRSPSPNSCHAFTTVESLEHGWWYANPLPDGRLVFGYMTDADLARRDDAFTASRWQHLLSQMDLIKHAVETRRLRVGEAGLQRTCYEIDGPLRVVPAGSSCLERATGDGWLAVGDAAAAHDPLSSQGILSGMIEGMWVADAIGKSAIGLAEYEGKSRHAYARYLAEWMSYYALEQRWPESPFWRRRHLQLRSLFAA